jgi:hypothetical protein
MMKKIENVEKKMKKIVLDVGVNKVDKVHIVVDSVVVAVEIALVAEAVVASVAVDQAQVGN